MIVPGDPLEPPFIGGMFNCHVFFLPKGPNKKTQSYIPILKQKFCGVNHHKITIKSPSNHHSITIKAH